jgi:DNA-binding CsgD family transcriptional regulator
MRDGYLRGALSPQATQRQMDVLAAYVAAGGSVQDAAELVGIRPSTVKRHLADLRARSGLTTEQLIYVGRAAGWLVVPILERDGPLDHSVRTESAEPLTTGGGQMPPPVR